MFSTVVVPVGFHDDVDAAVAHAAVLARQAGARLALSCVKPTYIDRAEVLARLGDIADRHEVDASLRVVTKQDAAGALVEAASEPGALLCMQTHARGPVTEMTLGSVSEQVLRTCRRPVLLIGPHCGPPPERFGSIVVGLDGSELAEGILPVATEWASVLGLASWLFQVLPAYAPFERGDADDHETAYVRHVVETLAQSDVKAEWDVVHDRNPAMAITRFAERRDDPVIALTTHGHSGLGRIAMGGVAIQVARNAPCPVLVLRPRRAAGDGG